MKDFAAIDFETANSCPESICSVGVVIVRNMQIAGSFYSLVRPEPEYYHYMNTRVHGLTAEDTCNCPVFAEVWGKIAPLIEGLPLVAHNSSFDERCLKAAFRVYRMDYPDYIFHCTCRASRRLLKGLVPDFRLDTVAAYLGCAMTNHHHALADARACAEIALRLLV